MTNTSVVSFSEGHYLINCPPDEHSLKIPRIIHYCWFGGNPKPEIVQKCIASWRKYCPDWEIIEWNEQNYDVSKFAYTNEAHQAKQWAFVSDVARLDVVCSHGGVYMDTDVELLSSIDSWLHHNAFFFWETEINIASGLGFGAQKEHPAVKAMLDYYADRHFIVNGTSDYTPCPAANTSAIRTLYPNIVRNGKTQVIDDIQIMSSAVYAQCAKHYGTGLWGDGPRSKRSNYRYKNSKLKQWLKRPEKFEFVQKFFGDKGLKLYIFLVYDLPERGVTYFLKRFFWKLKKKL